MGKAAESSRLLNLDGMRAYSAIAIILMHVKANANFNISNLFYRKVIPTFTNFTYFFMLLSAFSMCCGYYERFQTGSISLEQFYRRRYQRIWPYFAVLCTLELLIDHQTSSVYEWFADLTLAFGLLPNAQISIIGVGWFLGLIFVFYMLFPFFTFLIGNKKRAWFVMVITILLNVVCQVYFFDNAHVLPDFRARANILYSGIFFVAGGLIYLYRNEIQKLKKIPLLVIVLFTLAAIMLYYTLSASVFILLIIFSMLNILGIACNGKISKIVFRNRIILFLSSISLEIYLCHMVVYRVLEKLHLIHITNNEVLNYCFICIATVTGAIAMASLFKKAIDLLASKRS